MKILVLNAGSSSQKICLYEIGYSLPKNPPVPLWEARIEYSGTSEPAQVWVKNSSGKVLKEQHHVDSRPAAIRRVLERLWNGPAKVIANASAIEIVGHRVVHGGREFTQPTIVTKDVKSSLARLSELAPLHNVPALEGIEVVEKIFRSVLQVAVFDTAFHSRLPEATATYAGPYEWIGEGIRRYGFHGINHQYCAERAAQLLGSPLRRLRLITCHLGAGCSLAAVRDGRSIDTTMGFTPLEGLMMGTRSGSVDPGILIHLIRTHGYSAEALDDILNRKSGLLGISGVSSDMRQLVVAMRRGNRRARLAFEMFVHRLCACIGSMLASLGGVDALIFTAGIGENSAEVRAAACKALSFLGGKLDAKKNAPSGADRDISVRGSALRVLVIHAQEDWAIARECWRLSRAKRGR